MMDDLELLRRYANTNAQDAFAEFVARRVNLVYAVALRRVSGDARAAEEITQRVFTQLARQAAALCSHPAVNGWLFTTTHYTASKYIRSEVRRRRREREAFAMTQLTGEGTSDFDDRRVRLLLDEALMELSDLDREAVILRFFSGLGFAELGNRLKLTEDGARFRVNRALRKLERFLLKRGITSTSSVLGAALVNHAVGSVPPGLAAYISNSALAAVVSGPVSPLLTFLVMSKLKLGAAACVVLVGGGIWLLPLRKSDADNGTTPGESYLGYNAASAVTASQKSPSEFSAGMNRPISTDDRSADQRGPSLPEQVVTAGHSSSRDQLAKYDRYGDFFMQRRLSDEQSARLVDLLIQQDEARADLQAAVRLHQLDGDTAGIDDLRRKLYRPIIDEIEDILGAEGYREFREYEGVSAYRMAIVRPVSALLHDAGVPISDSQSARLVALLASYNQPVRRNSTDVTKEASIDWDAVIVEATEFMSPPQMVVLEREFVRRKENQVKRLGGVDQSASVHPASR